MLSCTTEGAGYRCRNRLAASIPGLSMASHRRYRLKAIARLWVKDEEVYSIRALTWLSIFHLSSRYPWWILTSGKVPPRCPTVTRPLLPSSTGRPAPRQLSSSTSISFNKPLCPASLNRAISRSFNFSTRAQQQRPPPSLSENNRRTIDRLHLAPSNCRKTTGIGEAT